MTSPLGQTPRTRRPMSLLARIGLMLGGLIVGLLLAEVLLVVTRLVPLSPYESDAICGTRLKANYADWQTDEGRVFVRTNRAGFRDVEHTLAKPPRTCRIAVLGDSYCEALQVELEEAFWAVMQRELNTCLPATAARVEVLNTGVSGYGTAQELLTLQHRVWDYQPDVVMLCVLPANDVRNNSQTLEPDQYRPFFRLDDDQLVLDNSFRELPLFASPWVRFKNQVVSSSRLGALVYRWRHPRDSSQDGHAVEAGLDSFIYSAPEQAVHHEAWRITERLIEEMAGEVERRGAYLVVVVLGSGIQVHPSASVRQSFAQQLGTSHLDYADHRVVSSVNRLGGRSLLLVDKMRDYAESQQVYLHGFPNTRLGEGHWNAAGHQLAGEIIATELCQDERFLEIVQP